MFTPQEVSEKVFPKASFGGYNMAAVDEFLDTLTEDYTSLYKDNATLKAKLKVLAEKIEEYRATEDAMRSTLLTAQKMASQLVQQAQTEKQQILTEAREEADRKTAALEAQTRLTEQKLALAQQKLSEFVSRSKELCAVQVTFLNALPELEMEDLQADSAKEAETVHMIEQDILKDMPAFDTAEEISDVEEAPITEEAAPQQPAVEETPVAQETPTIEMNPVIEDRPTVEEQPVVEKTISADFNLENLRFGRNYGSDN
ncbi:MAG: DivIVA domain-containing protein [Clostridiales bacterium]|nr:DivIVA domain-containing protein [Candidatus Cacconaster stercorequi]